jgi:uncharacterized protein YprB with RNaseH-like and TPR domain
VSTDATIIFLDIETAPSLGWVWAKWETNVIDFKQDWYILSVGYKRSTDKKVTVVGLDDVKRKSPEDDSALLDVIWEVLNEADIVVAHNGRKFDIPKINARLLTHKKNPPSPYKLVDTLDIARKVFAFSSNKLDDLSRDLGLGRKLPHTGFNLWKGCMDNDPKSWKLMKKYNGHDVILLEELYYLVRSWDKNHPNVNHGRTADEACPKCGSLKVQKRGFSFTMLRRKQRYQCTSCANWWEGSAKKA